MAKIVSQFSTLQEIDLDVSMHLNFVKGNRKSVSDAEISFRSIFKHFLDCLFIISHCASPLLG